MDTFFGDLRHAARTLRKSRLFTAVAVSTLAIGIGGTVTFFSLLNGVVLEPLPLRDAERLVVIRAEHAGRGMFGITSTGPDVLAWRDDSRSFAGVAPFMTRNVELTGRGDPAELVGGIVSRDYFGVVGSGALLGRSFTASEFGDAGADLVMLGEGVWRTRFGADSGVLGQRVTVNGRPRTVIGVVRSSADWLSGIDFFFSLPEIYHQTGIGVHMFEVIARLKPGVPVEQARAEVVALAARVDAERPERDRGWSATVVPVHDAVVGGVRRGLYMLLGAVGFLLLIVCANVAGLQIARASARSHEIAIRRALGASRARIARQLLAETVLLAFSGGVLGVLVAMWGVDLARGIGPETLPRLSEVTLDGRALAFAVLVTVAAGILCGLAPALHGARALRAGLGDGVRHTATRGAQLARSALVVGEIAVALTLLAGAGLMLRSLSRLNAIPLGFDPRQVLAVDLDLPSQRYNETERRTAFVNAVEERVRALPGVVSVGSTRALPLEGNGPFFTYEVAGRPSGAPGVNEGEGWYTPVTPSYRQALGIRLVAGRDLTTADNVASAPRVVVINETLARRHFPGQSPIGQRLRLRDVGEVEIVGVVADLRQRFLRNAPLPQMLAPFAQMPQLQLSMVVRTSTDPASLIAAIHREVWAVDPNLPVEEWTMDDLMRVEKAGTRFETSLLAAFAGTALLLAVVGVYALVSFSVLQRRREIGVRLALGAARLSVLRMVAREGAMLASLGVAFGLLGAMLLSGALEKLLYEVSATDTATLLGSALLLGVVCVAATLGPARRAANVDPMVALRD
jgi:predicted permease